MRCLSAGLMLSVALAGPAVFLVVEQGRRSCRARCVHRPPGVGRDAPDSELCCTKFRRRTEDTKGASLPRIRSISPTSAQQRAKGTAGEGPKFAARRQEPSRSSGSGPPSGRRATCQKRRRGRKKTRTLLTLCCPHVSDAALASRLPKAGGRQPSGGQVVLCCGPSVCGQSARCPSRKPPRAGGCRRATELLQGWFCRRLLAVA